jgi:asparaginyl-tRNA synthetase
MEKEHLNVLGTVGESYPFQKKYQSLEYLRDHLHLRARTNTASAVLRTRHHISTAVRQYLDFKDFIEVHTPLLTSNDCEGAGELFSVTTTQHHNLKDKEKTKNNERIEHFFDKSTYLTVSGQIHAEALACSMGKVYTFGPTFRAENSNTSRHLCEFWMVEPEMAFANMDDAIDIAEGTLQNTFKYVLENCSEELDFFGQQQPQQGGKGKSKQQQQHGDQLSTPRDIMIRMTYTEAIDVLDKSAFSTQWGLDLNSEQERWLVENHCNNQPLVVTDYPATIKPFYMRQNDDGKTVAAFDVLYPGVGEIIGGSGREERLDYLRRAMKERNIDENGLAWYVDLRKHGTVPHAGFGIGFERLLMACTGVRNVRDCIPFPRTPLSCPA